ncbi:MAG TPA: Gfo/Idh/MocA family oxidoreductase [Propionicimonas sp.]|nr:Gfo/Idh/MocA family oxidoreductase [Propionicimonas sp.]HRA05652.1 Gfo/Idh/MocA family oxidoreductase [Propionicimonas sp.]
MPKPLRIGILGAARIAERALIEPAAAIGAEVVAVAARDRSRAEGFAERHGVARAYGSYVELLADPDVEVVYNPLPNSEHAPLNLAALRAGKHVLTEKPFASNAGEARLVAAEPRDGLVLFEGFHHRYHPVYHRLLQLVGDGTIGDLTGLYVSMKFDCTDLTDIRWSWPLSGGAQMDLGCYTVHVARDVAAVLGGQVRPVAAKAGFREGIDPRVDASMLVEAELPGGVRAVLDSSLTEPADMRIIAAGTRGSAEVKSFIAPDFDDRLVLTVAGMETIEHLGTTSTYTYQLRALTAAVREGADFPTGAANAVANMEIVDECYRLAGLTVRGPSH